ncbi:MAG: hypothetical protein JRM86_04215 [Nitrososphaerota archaeon]|nr:hypothetical protein [Nitrososphaerota archaeon]MDG6967548.1 hypothetical protein [Nitrososphaerota archaeon]MDG6978873.1 hypothetical protein [Nitrososphaerota archaeon]MDG6981028.1 hypothetical protein [Nitrososphaerota archaeon]MDG7006118.1 hypothetical protein [Nitrososphaerota archaeon]
MGRRIVVGGWFDLPRLGRDTFAALMKQEVVYDRSLGFKLDSGTDIQSAVKTIRAATGEEVELVLRCFICGKPACEGCPYSQACDRTSVSTLCLCSDHAPERSVFEEYSRTFDLSLKG